MAWRMLGACALVVAFAAATQDIAIDAWRIEIAADADELGLLTSAYQLGYRVALLGTDARRSCSSPQHIGLAVVLRALWRRYGGGPDRQLSSRAEPVRADDVLAQKEMEAPLWTARGFFDAIAGPFIIFFQDPWRRRHC